MPSRTFGDERRSSLDEFSRTLSNFGMDVDHLEKLAAAARFMEQCEWAVLRDAPEHRDDHSAGLI